MSIGRQGIAKQCPERRKLHDDLLDRGEICSESRVARLASISGIAAQIGYKRCPGLFYNPKRKHTNNGILSPVDYEIKQQRMNTAGV
jgi:hypothetical protein